MLQNKSFVKKTKHGRVMKVVREHYLRDDIYCGVTVCKTCDSSAAVLSSSDSPVLIVDTNVILNQVVLKKAMFMTLPLVHHFRNTYGIEGPVYLTHNGQSGDGKRSKGGEGWVVDENHQQVKNLNSGKTYRVLQKVDIHMEVVEKQPNRPKLELSLLEE